MGAERLTGSVVNRLTGCEEFKLVLTLAGGWVGGRVAAGWRPLPCPWVFEAHNRGGSEHPPPSLLPDTMHIVQIMFYYGTKNTGIGGEGGGKQQGQNYPTKYDNHSV